MNGPEEWNDMPAAILVGYGSIGRRHAPILKTMFDRLAVVDPNPKALQDANHTLSPVVVVPGLAELGPEWLSDRTLAVIATWGPSHAQIFDQLVDAGLRQIVCEKPLAHSIRAGHQMLHRAQREEVSLGVNQSGRYIRRAIGIDSLAKQFNLGPPSSCVVHGGATCIVTTGIHYIDLASELFEAAPRSVVSSVRGEAINPRSASLGYYGGTAIWSYDGGREAILSMSNLSSVTPMIHIYYRDAVIEVRRLQNVIVKRRDMEAVARFPSVTRAGPADEVVFEGTIPHVVPLEEAFSTLYREVLDKRLVTCRPQDGLSALEACIGALSAGETGDRVLLPIDPDSEAGQREWPIS